jgi:hypothetical protein
MRGTKEHSGDLSKATRRKSNKEDVGSNSIDTEDLAEDERTNIFCSLQEENREGTKGTKEKGEKDHFSV